MIAARDAAEKEAEAAVEKDKMAGEARTAAEKGAAEASAKAKDAEAKKAAAADRAKAANEKAKPTDVTITAYSAPITFQVKPEEKK